MPEVTVSRSLNKDQVVELHHHLPFDPLDDDGNYGIEHYRSLLHCKNNGGNQAPKKAETVPNSTPNLVVHHHP